MAPPRRTFFIMLVTITGVLYFLYTIYTSTLDGPAYRFSSWSKVLGNLSYSSPLSQKKEEQYSNLNSLVGSISNVSNNNNGNSNSNNQNNNNNSNRTVNGNAESINSVGGDVNNKREGSVVAVGGGGPAQPSSNKTGDDVKNNNSNTNNNNKDNRSDGVVVAAAAVASAAVASSSSSQQKQQQEQEQVLQSGGEKVKSGESVRDAKGKVVQETNKEKELKGKESSKAKEKTNESVVQRIPPKMDNATVDYIVQGVITRTVYDSGFTLPNIELCPDFGSRLQVVIIITSAPKHVEARSAIRHTWGHYQLRKDVAIAFIVGRSPDVKESVIREENNLYGDIILANFIDSYNNLTLKTVSILEWVDNYCGQAKFVLKTDDDMFINIPKLLQFIGNHAKDKRKIFGKLAKKWKPIRKNTSKYYVSVKQYRNSLFPDFTTGPAYLMTSDVIHDLYMTALEKTYLKLEDVYTTGIVAQEERIQRVHVNEFFNRRITLSPCNVQKGISIHMIKPFEQYDLWKKLLDGRSKC